MYIVDVKTSNGYVRGIAVPDRDGTLVMIAGLGMEERRRWVFKKELRVCYKGVILPPEQYESMTVVYELDSYEKICVFHILDDGLKNKFTEFYRNELQHAELFWDKTKLFVQEHLASLLELSVIHELFRDGYAKENIVGMEVRKEDKRQSFNLSETSGTDRLIHLIRKTVWHAEKNALRGNVKIMQSIYSRLEQA